jgi:glycosyltransferase involved in cell wall biosynthesis
LVQPRNQAAIEAAVQRLIDDPGLLRRLRENGYQFAQNFSWARVASRTLDLYETAVAGLAGNV